jgi:hypothetical protein
MRVRNAPSVFARLLVVGCLVCLMACGGGAKAPSDSGSMDDTGIASPRTDAWIPADVFEPDVVSAAPAGLLNADYTTVWNPGILADIPTGAALGADNLPVRATVCASVPVQTGDATTAIQTALNGCAGKHQVVALAAGKYSVSTTIQVPSGVVLRGAGSDPSTGTIVVSTKTSNAAGPVLAIGNEQDQACYDSNFDSSARPLLAQDAVKETSVLAVASAAGFKAGDLALIDQKDTSEISVCGFFQRKNGYALSERIEISAVSGNTLTLTSPVHWTFKTGQGAQVSRAKNPTTKWSAIESLAVQGGRPGGYDGQWAGGIDIANAAYCWVKDVQIDGTTSGMPIRLNGTYRCVVRDSHVHNSHKYGFGQDNYGIVLACGAADNLIENNIARFMNKPILFNNSGGGNVIGYNYADNAWACDTNNDDGWQEVAIDTHCAFPHMELIEGNWAPHMGATTTHGNAGYLTFFRNYASTQWTPTNDGKQQAITWSLPVVPQYGNVTALDLPAGDTKMTVIGNVLGSASDTSLGLPADLGTTGTSATAKATTKAFFATNGAPSITNIDKSSVTWTTLWMTGNYDTFNKSVQWNASPMTASLPTSTHELPASLYYAAKPTWWPTGQPWPWTGPDVSPMVGTLPAKQRSAAFNYATAANPACTLDSGNQCCYTSPATGCSPLNN